MCADPQKTGPEGDTSDLKPEGPGSLAGSKGTRRAALGARTSLMRQLCEFRSRWMIHMECANRPGTRGELRAHGRSIG